MLAPERSCACVDPDWVDTTTQLDRAHTKFVNATGAVDQAQAELLALHGEWLALHDYRLNILFVLVFFIGLAVARLQRRSH